MLSLIPSLRTPRHEAGILSFKNCLLALMMTLLTIKASSIHANPSTQANQRTQTSDNTTTVYKRIEADGSVSFSDQPQAASEKLLIAPVTTVPAIKPIQNPPVREIDKSNPIIYGTLEILSPANNTSFHSGSGDVEVSMRIEPALFYSHEIDLYLDGNLLVRSRDLQRTLKKVDRGTHELHVKVVDRENNILGEARSVFTVHRPIAR